MEEGMKHAIAITKEFRQTFMGWWQTKRTHFSLNSFPTNQEALFQTTMDRIHSSSISKLGSLHTPIL